MSTPGPTTGYLLWRLAMKWRAAGDRALASLGLTHAQYAVLAPLYAMTSAGGAPSQRQLADHTGLEPVYVSKLVRALERYGLVTRTESPADPRSVQLRLTERGTEVAGRAIATIAALQEELTPPLGGSQGEETQRLRDLLRRLLDPHAPSA